MGLQRYSFNDFRLQRQLQDAVKLQHDGHTDAAMQECQAILKNHPQHAATLHLLGLLTHQQGNMREAAELIEQAICFNPNVAQCHNDLGVVLHQQQRLEQALAAYDQAVSIDPQYAAAHLNRAIVLQQQQRFAAALVAYDDVLLRTPGDVNAHLNRGVVLQHLRRFDETLAAYDEALRLQPDYVDAHCNRGAILQRLGRREEALAAFKQALCFDAENAFLWVNVGAAQARLGLAKEALAAYDQAVHLDPNLAQAHNNRGTALKMMGRYAEALAAFKQAVHLQPDYSKAQSNYLFCMNYDATQDDQALYKAHREWNDCYAQHPQAFASYDNAPDADKILRVGLLSADFGHHPVGYLLDPLLAAADSTKLQFFAYSGRLQDDDLTERLRANTRGWHSTVALGDTTLAATIRADGIDILLDLAGHTAGNRLPCCALRPAPIQAHWAGYCHSVGAVDYSIWDAIHVPKGEERWFTEKVLRLPDMRWCYAAPEYAPEPGPPPALKRGYITFGCFGNLSKLNPNVIQLWARLLKELPNSKLLLSWRSFAADVERDRFRSYFVAYGIEPRRIELIPGIRTPA